jgi:hypothetical protein
MMLLMQRLMICGVLLCLPLTAQQSALTLVIHSDEIEEPSASAVPATEVDGSPSQFGLVTLFHGGQRPMIAYRPRGVH